MSQLKKSYTEISVPLNKMSFTPDVPSNALAANEYNAGENVETDVRGIRSVLGEAEILNSVPGTPTYITGGFRHSGEFWFIVATTAAQWWASNGTGGWTNITPTNPNWTNTRFDRTYDQSMNITEAWNGTVPIFNDTINPPFFWEDDATNPTKPLTLYSNEVPHGIDTIAYYSPTVQKITVATAYTTAPFAPGDKIVITGTNNFYNGTFTVADIGGGVGSTTTEIYYLASPGGAYSASSPQVAAAYTWNYDPNLKNVAAGFMRIYSTPNVGNILVAGDLYTTALDNSVHNYPVTVQWSQAFGINDAPLSWQPTVLNVANQLEVPLRGRVLDAFPANGNLYLCSYWDTVVFTPMNYATTSTPILGVRLFNQGRGLINANCWANTDNVVYGIDARDIWMFNGSSFQGIGNQRVKHWFFDQLDPQYWARVYMITNTEKNQIEIYFPDANASEGVPNKMLSYRYDLDCWNAPRDVLKATFACESPEWSEVSPSVWDFNPASRTVVYAKGAEDTPLIQKDDGYLFIKADGDTRPIVSSFRRDNIKLVKDYSSKSLVHRVLPEIVNLNSNNVAIDPSVDTALIGNVGATIEGANSVGQTPQYRVAQYISTDTDYPWVQINQNANRVSSIELSSDSTTPGTIWMCCSITFQFAEVEDDR